MSNKSSGYEHDGCFELTLQVRDKNGNPTGKTRSFRTNEASRLATWFEQTIFRSTKKKAKNIDKKEQISSDLADEILAELYGNNEN